MGSRRRALLDSHGLGCASVILLTRVRYWSLIQKAVGFDTKTVNGRYRNVSRMRIVRARYQDGAGQEVCAPPTPTPPPPPSPTTLRTHPNPSSALLMRQMRLVGIEVGPLAMRRLQSELAAYAGGGGGAGPSSDAKPDLKKRPHSFGGPGDSSHYDKRPHASSSHGAGSSSAAAGPSDTATGSSSSYATSKKPPKQTVPTAAPADPTRHARGTSVQVSALPLVSP